MRLLKRHKKDAHVAEHGDLENLVSIRIKGQKSGLGAAEMIVSGEINNDHCLEVFKKALHRFEDMPNMKHYLDLGGVHGFSTDAAQETLCHIDRMTEHTSLFGIVDVSDQTARAMSDIGAYSALREAYLGDYRMRNMAVAVG